MTATLKTTIIQEPSSATNNLTLDTSGGVTVGQNLSVTGSISATGGGLGGRLLRAPQVYTTGSGNYTTPAGCTAIYVEMVGGGGGGTQTGSGGGAGGYAAKYFSPVVPLTAYAYAVGTGGAAGASTGGTGGNTTFTALGTTVTATGAAGTTGGTPTNGDVNIRGGNGNPFGTGGGDASGMAGAASFFGGGGGGGAGNGTVGGAGGAGTAGVAGGGGGGGGQASGSGSSDGAGGAGGAGLIRIWEYA